MELPNSDYDVEYYEEEYEITDNSILSPQSKSKAVMDKISLKEAEQLHKATRALHSRQSS